MQSSSNIIRLTAIQITKEVNVYYFKGMPVSVDEFSIETLRERFSEEEMKEMLDAEKEMFGKILSAEERIRFLLATEEVGGFDE